MTLEQQVVSLEIAKRLKELGVKQESLFKWFISPEGWKVVAVSEDTGKLICPSAFTVAELGEMLPTYNPSYRLTRNSTKENVFVCENNSNADIAFTADTEADARGKMLIYLLENKLITT